MADNARPAHQGAENLAHGEHIGYQPEYTSLSKFRRNLRNFLDSLWVETFVILLVCIYAVIIFIDMTRGNTTMEDPKPCLPFTSIEILEMGNMTLQTLCSLTEERGALYYLDLSFLIVFSIEICIRFFALGVAFFRDYIQATDSVVVVLALVTTLVPSEALAASGNLLNLLRIIRLLRLAVIINRLQRSRDVAAMRSKRAMYRRLGAPVEKVLSFLADFRSRQTKKRDQDNIDWMMEVIASDELYAVAEFDEETLAHMQGAAAGSAGDMSRYLSSETGLARRRANSFESSSEEEGGDPEEKEKKDGQQVIIGKRKISAATLQLWAGAAIATSGLSHKLQRLVSPEAWSFDVFEYDMACSMLPEPGTGKTATLLSYYLLEQHGVLDALQIERPKMLAWLSRIDEGYIRANPYHNALHAADVCANVDYFIRQTNLSRLLGPVDLLAALVAALIHDMAHPGVNNTFLEATKHELAITYNDVSVLENHHVAAAFKLLKNSELDWTTTLQLEDYKDFRETVIQMVLGTDMRAHFEHLTKFKSKLAGEGYVQQHIERKDMRLLLTMALHAADISNPAKPQPIATAWAKRSMEEFFRQGDKEAELGLPVSPFMDRSKVPLAATIVNCQIGFINVLVRPLLSEWAAFLGPEAERDIIVTLEATLRLWETSGAKVIDSWGDFAKPPNSAVSASMDTGLKGKDGKKDGGKDIARKVEGGGGSHRNQTLAR